MSDEDTTLELDETRRNVVKGLAVGAGGLALPSLSADTAAAGDLVLKDVGPYASDKIRYTDPKRNSRDVDFSNFVGYTPTDTSQRVNQSVVAHTGPRRKPSMDGVVEYTIIVKTTGSCLWVDSSGNYHSPHHNLRQVEHVVDYEDDDAVTVDFPDRTNERWAGSLNIKTGQGDPLEDLMNNDTVRGVLLNFAVGELTGMAKDYIPFLDAGIKYYTLLSDIINAAQDNTKRTIEFDYTGMTLPYAVSTYRKFVVRMNETDTTDLSFKTRIRHSRKDYQLNEHTHTLTLDPSTFLKDVGTHPFEQETRSLTAQTGVSGYPNDPDAVFAGRQFNPEGEITRAQFASMIDDAFEPNPASTETFSDIAGHWAEEKIERVAGAGYISGYPDGTFRPDQNITKHEVWLALHAGRNYGSKYNGTVTDLWEEFVDVNELPTWDGAREAVANVLAAWGDIENYPDQQKLEPNKNATRAEAAKYIYEAAYLAGEIV
jgi:hypothetical protein